MSADRLSRQVSTPSGVGSRRTSAPACLVRRMASALLLSSCIAALARAQSKAQPDWKAVEQETMQHYQAVLRLDTSNPPGNEHLVADYLKQVFDK